jgi:hypothetical protein
MKHKTTILLTVILASFGLLSCQSKRILTTSEGIYRKVVVREDDTPLYDSTQFKDNVATVNQWDILYVYGDSKSKNSWDISKFFQNSHSKNYYIVSRGIKENLETPMYINKNDVFEWNSYFCISYKTSPHQSGRDRIITYETLKAAKEHDKSQSHIREKEKHGVHRNASPDPNCKPILEEHKNGIYHIATLYDNIDEEGNYVFLGNYDFGYVHYNKNAHQFYRYVNKGQLDSQLKIVLGVTGKAKPNLNPSEVDSIYGPLTTLLANFENINRGIEDITKIFESSDMPSETQKGLFESESFTSDIENLDPKLRQISQKMFDTLNNSDKWNENGYTYIPAEWMEESK